MIETYAVVALGLVLWLAVGAWFCGLMFIEARAIWRVMRGNPPEPDDLAVISWRRVAWPYYAWKRLGAPDPNDEATRHAMHLRTVGMADQLAAAVRQHPWSWWRVKAYAVLAATRFAHRLMRWGSKNSQRPPNK